MKFKNIVVYGTIIILLIVSAQLFRLYRQPLGHALDLPTSTQNAKPTLTTFPIETNVADGTATVQPTATSQPLCGGPSVMNILAIGSDSRGAD